MTVATAATTKRVLTIAGSDSGGGAGVQGDLKTIAALGVYGASVVTALTAQNTEGVDEIHPTPADFVKAQIGAVLGDIGVDAVKIGMMGESPTIRVIGDALMELGEDMPAVVDPVMIASSGARLISDEAVEEMKRRVLLYCTMITPNILEAGALCRLSIKNVDDMRKAAERLLSFGCEAALVKGGDLEGDVVRDVLVTFDEEEVFESPRIQTRNTHGTGCALSSAIAVHLAKGYEPAEAVRRSRRYVYRAIETAPGLGSGAGPLNHAWTARDAEPLLADDPWA